MPGGLRAKSLTFAFPFYERKDSKSRDETSREEMVIRVFSKLPFVKEVWVDKDRLREPLFIEVNLQSPFLQDKTIAQIEEGLEKMLGKIYNFRECL